MAQVALNFRTAFCRVHRCAEDQYHREVFRRALHRHALPVAWLIARLNRRFFREDHRLIDEIGLLTQHQDLVGALNGYREDCHMRGSYFHNRLRFRISGQRLITLFGKTLEQAGLSQPENPACRAGPTPAKS